MDDIDSDDHDQEDIIIPIKDKTRDLSPSGLGYRTENGVTVIKIDKSNNGNVCMWDLFLLSEITEQSWKTHEGNAQSYLFLL